MKVNLFMHVAVVFICHLLAAYMYVNIMFNISLLTSVLFN